MPHIQDEGGALNCTGTRFLHANQQGSIIAASNCSGQIAAVNRYDEYGIPQATWREFRGHEFRGHYTKLHNSLFADIFGITVTVHLIDE